MKNQGHLRQEERYTIERLLERGMSQAGIARALERSASTISRELIRNVSCSKGRYESKRANKLASERRRQASSRVRRLSPGVIVRIEKRLRENQWSPEQIGATMPGSLGGRLSHESVYGHVRRDRAAGGDLYKHLRRGGRRKRRSVSAETRGKLKDATPLESRPAIVERRGRYGDWEVDLMACVDGYAVVCRERKSQVLRVGRVASKEAEAVGWKVVEVLAGLKRHTLTWDRGLENARHKEVDEILGCQSYFCKPYRSWEKPCVEHSNGLLRQYLNRQASILNLTRDDLETIERSLNTRPRKLLGWRTPATLMHRHLLNDSQCSKEFLSYPKEV